MALDEHKSSLGAYFYRPGMLNRWFLISCVLMTVGYVWSVVDDYQRPWKKYQRAFMDVELHVTASNRDQEWLAAGGTAVDEKIAALEAQRDLQQEFLDADRHRRPELVDAVGKAELKFNQDNARMKAAKAFFEAERFHYEELAHLRGETDLWNPQNEEVRAALSHYEERKARYLELDEVNRVAEAEMNAAVAALKQYDQQVTNAQAEIDATEREMARLERRMLHVDRDRWFTSFRNSIFFDFMAPNVQVKKIVVGEIHDDVLFTTVPKVDMCITCHQATDRYRDYPYGAPMFQAEVEDGVEYSADPREWFRNGPPINKAFQAHPRPELFATSLSPHDQGRFGCSGCHGGGNQRVDFSMAAHTPSDPAERERWQDEYHYHEVHYWDNPQLPTQYLEASCFKCHDQQVEIPGADKWNRGRDLVGAYGCFGCHKIDSFEGHRKTGPPLYNMNSKYQSIEWTLKWVQNPQAFRPTTRMPRFFHLENRDDDPERQQAEITALVHYLYNQTSPVDLMPYRGNGDAARGKALFGEDGGVGCLACHNIDDFEVQELTDRHGPDLSGIGSKANPDWLMTWLMDPKALWADTNMPNLRLTMQETSDLVAYLMTKTNAGFEAATFERPGSDDVYREIVREKLVEQMTEERANQQIARMSATDLRLKAGESLLNHYGCFGCHDIAGFEEAKQIGTELNGWGSKHADRLDFGLFEHDYKHNEQFNRIAWLERKLENTRFWDRGKDKGPFEKLKMPQFPFPMDPDQDQSRVDHGHLSNISNGDLEAIMTFVLSLVKEPIEDSIKRHLSPAEVAVQRGKQIVQDKNCLGCHVLYKEGGEIRRFMIAQADGADDSIKEQNASGFFPPLIDGQGAKTQHDWLFGFLTDPAQGGGRGSKQYLRPWLHTRMPTFEFSQEQLNDVVAYFAHEEVWHTAEDQGAYEEEMATLRANFDGYSPLDLRTGDAGKTALFNALVARNYRSKGGAFLYETDFPYLSEVGRELTPETREVARDFFAALECIECHRPGGVPPEGKKPEDMAPELIFARHRLQPSWVKKWIGRPGEYQPGTRMPGLWDYNAETRTFSSHPLSDLDDADAEQSLIRDYIFSNTFESDLDQMLKDASNP